MAEKAILRRMDKFECSKFKIQNEILRCAQSKGLCENDSEGK